MLAFSSGNSGTADDVVVTYAGHVRPIFAQRCLSCHNPDKASGGLILASYQAAIAGSSGGEIVIPGDPDASPLIGAISHTREPKMPPLGDKLSDESIATIRKWIEQGCRDTATSMPRQPPKPAVTLAMSGTPIARPAVAPPMPRGLPLSPAVVTQRADAITTLATHPWLPLVALRGTGQIALYDTSNGDLCGILPFAPGQPETLCFSRSGELLIAGGGVGGQSGRVLIWSAKDGALVSTIGDEFDVVLAADIDPSQQFVALGGPSRIVKVYDVRNGNLIRRIEKHTEWITAVAYSPDGILMATADRNGRLFVWEAESGAPFYALGGHGSAITSMDWRADGDVLATAGEDGQIKLWEMYGGKQAKAWSAHPGGALSVRFAHDGRIVSTGRDRTAKVWAPDGKLVRAIDGFADITLSGAFTTDGRAIVAGDWAGTARIVRVDDGVDSSGLAANPAPYDQQLLAAERKLSAARVAVEASNEASRTADGDLVDKQQALANASEALGKAQAAAASASNDAAVSEQAVVDTEQALVKAQGQLKQSQTQLAAAGKVLKTALEARQASVKRETAGQARMTSLEGLLSAAQQAAHAATEVSAAAGGNAALARLAAEAVTVVQSTEAALADARGELAVAGGDRTNSTTAVEHATAARDTAVATEQTARHAVEQRSVGTDSARNTRDVRATVLETVASRVGPAQQTLESVRQATTASETVQVAALRAREQAHVGLRRAERVAARWQAEGVRLKLVAAGKTLSALTKAHEPVLQAANAAQQAAEAATIRLTRAEKRLEEMPKRVTDAEARCSKAEAELTRSRAWLAAAEAAIAPQEQVIVVFKQAAEQLRDHSTSQPDSTSMQEAVEYTARALASLRAELAVRHAAVETAQLAIEESEFDQFEAEEARAAIVSEREALPARINELRLTAVPAREHAADTRAKADLAYAPVATAAQEVEALSGQFEGLLDQAFPIPPETAP